MIVSRCTWDNHLQNLCRNRNLRALPWSGLLNKTRPLQRSSTVPLGTRSCTARRPIITNVEVSLSARRLQVFVPPTTAVSMAQHSVNLSALPDKCSCFLSSWGRPHLVLPTLRAQERDEHALYAYLLRHDFSDLLERPMKRMRDYLLRVGRVPRHFHRSFRGEQDATLFLLLRPVVAILCSVRRDPLSQLCLRLVLDDLFQQRFDALDPAQHCLVDSLRRHVHGQCGQEGQEHVEVRTAQIVFASSHQLRVLLASLPHVF